MAKQTLTVQLTRANARIAELEAMVISIDEIRSEQSVRIDELETLLAVATAPRGNVRPAYVAPVRVVPEWQQARLAAMAAAREEAARTGRCVRVA